MITRKELIAELQEDWNKIWDAPVAFPFEEGDLLKTTGAVTCEKWVGGVVVNVNPPFFEARWSDGVIRSHDIRAARNLFIKVDVDKLLVLRQGMEKKWGALL